MIANSSSITVTIATTVSILMIIYGIATESRRCASSRACVCVCVFTTKIFNWDFTQIFTSVVVDVATTAAATDTRSLTPSHRHKISLFSTNEHKNAQRRTFQAISEIVIQYVFFLLHFIRVVRLITHPFLISYFGTSLFCSVGLEFKFSSEKNSMQTFLFLFWLVLVFSFLCYDTFPFDVRLESGNSQ